MAIQFLYHSSFAKALIVVYKKKHATELSSTPKNLRW